MLMDLSRSPRERLDLDAIRRDYRLPEIVGAVVKLQRAGNELKACCPLHSDRSPSFTIFDAGRRFHCFGCGASGDVLDFIQALHGVGLREAAEMLTGGEMPSVTVAPLPVKDDSDKIAEARAVWEASQPIGGTVAECYLRGRALHLPLPEALRFAVLPYGKRGGVYPAMVAAVTDLSGNVIGVQRTYLAANGTGKADVPAAKLSLGRITGGAVRLTPPSRSMILCEGTEDALSIIQSTGRAAWAALGTSSLGKVELPFATEDVVIGADNDEAGEAAAQKAARAYAERGCRTRIIRPLPGFKDWNDELQNNIQEAC